MLFRSLDCSFVAGETPDRYETPLSSVCSEELIDPAIRAVAAVPTLDDVDLVDLTTVDNIPPAKFPAARATTSTY